MLRRVFSGAAAVALFAALPALADPPPHPWFMAVHLSTIALDRAAR